MHIPVFVSAFFVCFALGVDAFHKFPPRFGRVANFQGFSDAVVQRDVRSVRVADLRRYAVSNEKKSAVVVEDDNDDDDDVEYTVGMPDKAAFSEYFRKTVKPGAELTLEQLMSYDVVSQLLSDEAVYAEDINDLWISAVGDATGLNEGEAYEMLCMITDLPDPEDAEFYDKEFEKLTGGKGQLPFFKFVSWKDVQDMMDEEALTMEEITQIWRQVCGDLNSSIDRKLFGKLNNALDDAIDEKENAAKGGTGEGTEADEDVDLTGVDVYAASFDPASVFDAESLEEITAFFSKNAAGGLDGTLSFTKFRDWDDVQGMLREGAITLPALEGAWVEASKGKTSIDLDTFLRLNVKLDLIMDEIEASSAPSSAAPAKADDSEDAESFYRSEFKKVTGGGRLMRLDMLLGWKEVAELISEGVISEKQVVRMFEGMPKEPMGIPSETFGITEDSFVAFNGMLDVVLDASGGDGGSSPGSLQKAATPTLLVSEPARPMPSVSELKMGSLGSGDSRDGDDDASTGLSPAELEMMEVLDKADNMLNSGSFGDFDQLIGDINDPRLQALRDKTEGAEQVRGQLQDVLKELLSTCRKQSRCGLDRPEEEVAARIRDLIQAVIEKAPRAASRDITSLRNDINGKWKLLYTNSEMFSFYNGVTGFANVFPTAKFQDLSMQYSSDGFLSESRYLEKLNTALGGVDATVYSTWELVKEMSFMTNENSVVLRNYCTKVTAGPMEYLAEENWKSLRTMSMNEVLYVDDKVKIMRNTGALRIFFVYERE